MKHLCKILQYLININKKYLKSKRNNIKTCVIFVVNLKFVIIADNP